MDFHYTLALFVGYKHAYFTQFNHLEKHKVNHTYLPPESGYCTSDMSNVGMHDKSKFPDMEFTCGFVALDREIMIVPSESVLKSRWCVGKYFILFYFVVIFCIKIAVFYFVYFDL